MANEALIWVCERYDGLCHSQFTKTQRVRQRLRIHQATREGGRRDQCSNPEDWALPVAEGMPSCKPSPQFPAIVTVPLRPQRLVAPKRCFKDPQVPSAIISAVKHRFRPIKHTAIEGMRFMTLLGEICQRLLQNAGLHGCTHSTFRNCNNFISNSL